MSDLHQQEKHPFLDFVKNNKQKLVGLLVVVVVVLAGYFGYTELYQNPREAKAADAMLNWNRPATLISRRQKERKLFINGA